MHPKVAENTGLDDIPSNHEEDFEVTGGVERFLDADGVCTHPASMEQEKRIRREVANSNERRRMQSINAGFLTLRAMLPQREGEKLSKAAILQQTSDFICNLEQEKTRLLTQNCQLKRLLGPQTGGGESPDPPADSPAPPPPQSVVPCSASQEDLTACDATHPPPLPPDPLPLQTLQLELQELRAQLERERLQRLSAEERLRQAEQQHQQQQEQLQQQQQEQLQQQQQQQQQEQQEHHSREHYYQQEHHQQQQQQHCVHMRFKKPRLEPDTSPPLLMEEQDEMMMTEQVEMMKEEVLMMKEEDEMMSEEAEEDPLEQSPPPPPVAPRRPSLYMSSSTSRQNLDTIVEAIRHLEGDHLFADCSEPMQTRLEPAQTRLEPAQIHLETAQTHLEPAQTRLEPLPACIETIQTHLEPIQSRLEPSQTGLEAIHSRLDLQQQQQPCLELEPQEAPLELTTHARSSSVDPYRPAVIVAQHRPLRH